jgi:hypothetical protein
MERLLIVNASGNPANSSYGALHECECDAIDAIEYLQNKCQTGEDYTICKVEVTIKKRICTYHAEDKGEGK